MSRLDIYRKQAKQLVRWHREGNHSIGGRIRGLARYRTLTDREALALEFPLREAQEIIALEAGYASWAAAEGRRRQRANAGESRRAAAAINTRRARHLRRQRAGRRRVLQRIRWASRSISSTAIRPFMARSRATAPACT